MRAARWAPRAALAASLTLLLCLSCDFPGSSPPEAPRGLAVVSTGLTSLAISWEPSEDALGYELYRDLDPQGAFAAKAYDGNSTSFVDEGLAIDTTYYYRVLAKNGAGKSPLSAPVAFFLGSVTAAGTIY